MSPTYPNYPKGIVAYNGGVFVRKWPLAHKARYLYSYLDSPSKSRRPGSPHAHAAHV